MQRANVFDIDLLERRLVEVITWLRHERQRTGHPVPDIGLFGASTGAAAALVVAARPDSQVSCVVSRGGRPDLAGEALGRVRVPTLLIVGGHDQAVLELNRAAQARLGGPSELAVVPSASHLFTEPGTLSRAAELARDWFLAHLAQRTRHRPVSGS
jgi:putative phosphoribosyl transferase